MVKAAENIRRPDGSMIKKGATLPDELVFEFERGSPQLLDCYVTQNSRYWKKIGNKLVPHNIVLEKDLVEVKNNPKGKERLPVEKKKVEDMSKVELDEYAKNKGVELDRRQSKDKMLNELKRKLK